MAGGLIVQVIEGTHSWVEILDKYTFDRCWRRCKSTGFQVGDELWWQSRRGMLTREGHFEDKYVGECDPANHPKNKTLKM